MRPLRRNRLRHSYRQRRVFFSARPWTRNIEQQHEAATTDKRNPKPNDGMNAIRKVSGAGRQGGGDGESRGKNDQTPDILRLPKDPRGLASIFLISIHASKRMVRCRFRFLHRFLGHTDFIDSWFSRRCRGRPRFGSGRQIGFLHPIRHT